MPACLARTTTWASIALAAAAMPAHAARPMVTDDARIVDPKSCQLESWWRRNRGGGTELWLLPGCNPTGGIELTLGGGWTHVDGSTSNTDRVLQAKTLWRTLEGNSTWAWGTAVGMVDRPQAGGTDVYGYVPLTVSLYEGRLFVHANLGLRRDDASRRNVTTSGLGLEAQLSPRVWAVGEAFVQDRGRPLYQFGMRYWLVPDRVQVDTTFGDRLGAGGQERWISIGLRLLSPAFLP